MLAGGLSFSLMIIWAVLQGVTCRPSIYYAVDFLTCEETERFNSSTKCVSVCLPIHAAIQNCSRSIACACAIAPPIAVEACSRCHVVTSEYAYSQETVNLVSSRLIAYSQLCEGMPVIREYRNLAKNTSLTTYNSSLSRREVTNASCIFGLPEMTLAGPGAFIRGQRKLWPLYAIIISILMYVTRRRT
ncbi:hypothetical protein AcW1_002107 [Taiwanofungus camphoratus]|nr:hypothetical protein AcW1_002107 [Antrodia cinnamomea]KAI0946021.1 hypothetical protein AcV7_010111 [Antrodia cinnamomea]